MFPDPSFTVNNVTKSLEKVKVDKKGRVLEEILNKAVVEEIYGSYSSEKEKLHSCAEIYVTSDPDSSFKDLVDWLYQYGEMAAAKEAKSFLPKTGG